MYSVFHQLLQHSLTHGSANVGNARIQGMGVELGLNTGYRFNWVTSIFYIVYMFVEGKYPTSHDT